MRALLTAMALLLAIGNADAAPIRVRLRGPLYLTKYQENGVSVLAPASIGRTHFEDVNISDTGNSVVITDRVTRRSYRMSRVGKGWLVKIHDASVAVGGMICEEQSVYSYSKPSRTYQLGFASGIECPDGGTIAALYIGNWRR